MPFNISPIQSSLLVIDWQQRLLPAIDNGAPAVLNTCRLLGCAELLQIPALLTEQMPDRLGSTVCEVKNLHTGPVFHKSAFNACAEQKMLDSLANRREVIVTGAETHVCVLQTVMGLLERGFTVWVVADACGSRTEANKQAGIERMRAAGASIVSTEMVMFEWLQSAEHPEFKEVLALIK